MMCRLMGWRYVHEGWVDGDVRGAHDWDATQSVTIQILGYENARYRQE
jgi:hypothetical protein